MAELKFDLQFEIMMSFSGLWNMWAPLRSRSEGEDLNQEHVWGGASLLNGLIPSSPSRVCVP